MNDAAAWAGVIIGGGSLVVSMLAVWKSSRAQREANAAQKRIVEIEEQREREKRLEAKQAHLRPELRKVERDTYRLYLLNHGKAEARNIRIKLDGMPLAEHCAAVQNDRMPVFLGPGAECSVPLAFRYGCAPPFEIEITWDDDYSTDRSYRTTLTP